MHQNKTEKKNFLGEKKETKIQSVVDYLQAPRKKRRSFILLAMQGKTEEFVPALDSFISKNFPTASIINARSEDDLKRSFRRHLILVIADDEFLERYRILDLVYIYKSQHHDRSVPIIFLTKSPRKLIDVYRHKMSSFQEVDDYVDYTRFGQDYINSKIKMSLSDHVRRRSRRYKIEIPVTFQLLNKNNKKVGVIRDISINGCLLESRDDYVFVMGEQLVLDISLLNKHDFVNGEFLHVACRVRRLMISGKVVGISFEHQSEYQKGFILEFVADLARRFLISRSQESKNR